jgi:hypothetical protein
MEFVVNRKVKKKILVMKYGCKYNANIIIDVDLRLEGTSKEINSYERPSAVCFGPKSVSQSISGY